MAVTLKRRRGHVSYKDPSSDEEESYDSEQSGQTNERKRAAPSRRSNRHAGSSSHRQSPIVRRNAPGNSRSSRRNHRQNISYKDVSTDDEGEDPDADFVMSEDEPAPKARSSTTFQSPRAQKTTKAKGKSPRKLVIGAPLKPNVPIVNDTTGPPIPSDGKVPAWTSLPYHVLLQVFVYASHPLRDENMRPMSSIPWLVEAARICSAFTKPALTALYRNPPIFATRQTRKDLVHHLISPPPNAHEDHRVMVKRLELDATQMTSLTDHANSVADLGALVRSLITLREIDIFDPIDRPPFRGRLRRIRRWVYPLELFEVLRKSEVHLRSWRWNSTFCDQGLLWIKTIHSDTAFQSLRELTLTKFHPAEIREDQDEREDVQGQPTTEELVGSALAVLPNLKSLSFETCGVVSGRLLPLLPSNLVILNITNCGELLSDALQAFLSTHGTHLEELTLNYNQSLDLSFLVDLKSSCPRLEVLRMDLTYYNTLSMSSDNDPLYETLLGEGEMPTWPSTLRILDMQFLRNWNLTSATNFLSSLMEAAGDLPWLRELTIIAMVDADWRQRAEFRTKWTARFKKVFARKWVPPNPHLVSLKAFRDWQAQKPSGDNKPSIPVPQSGTLSEVVEDVQNENSESDSDAPLVPSRAHEHDEAWGSKRLRSRSNHVANYDESSDDDNSEGDGDSPEDDEVTVVQGRCHTVLFRIDNSRPKEDHYTEADFLDAEPSGDEDWNGNDDNNNNEEGGYAW